MKFGLNVLPSQNKIELANLQSRPRTLQVALARLLLLLALATSAMANTLVSAPMPNDRVGTGFGVNNTRDFAINAATQYMLDGEEIVGEPTPSQAGAGSSVFARLAADATLSSGLAEFVEINTQLRGPVTQLSPLQVLGQNLTVDADTVLLGMPAAGINSLSPGTILAVSGQVDANNSLIATRLSLQANAPNWRLTGFVTDLSAGMLQIGSQLVNIKVAALNCGSGIAVGNYVEIRAAAQSPYVIGAPISANQIRCSTPTPNVTVAGAPVVATGLIGALLQNGRFLLGTLNVEMNAQTSYRYGNAGDLGLGVGIEVEGFYSGANLISASKIRFIRRSIRLQAPVSPGDISPNESLTILGNSIKNSAQLRDPANVFALGLNQPRQLEVRAYQDSAGNFYATRVTNISAPVFNDYTLQGPASEIEAAMTRCKVFGTTISASNSYSTVNGVMVTPQQFYASLTNSMLVRIEHAVFDPNTNTLSGGSVTIAEDDVPLRFADSMSAQPHAPGSQISGTMNDPSFELLQRVGFED